MLFSSAESWDKLHIVHCGVEPELFEAREHAANGGQLLFVGRLAGIKGVPLLLESLARLVATRPRLHLTLIGDGPDRQALEAQTERLGLGAHVEFAGYRSQQEVRERMAETDVLVLPSFAEGVPVTLMEALAAGVGVVASGVAGVSELVLEGVSGFLVPPGDVETLTERIGELLDDPALRTRHGAAGRAHVVREFDVRREAGRLHALLEASRRGETLGLRPEPLEAPTPEPRKEPGRLDA